MQGGLIVWPVVSAVRLWRSGRRQAALILALSAAGRLAEAEGVVRANLATVTALHGAEHRMTLGTTLNLGLLLEGLGRHDEAAAVYDALLATQRRVLGDEPGVEDRE